ncbi:unnamed protein product [Arabis nemorensis]|uniref:Pentacotripeptide-repeat region of PRORP domain-containing protein n=1 Tax=Arabis nemorensis TaxID=586526 RepID=A0A565APC0_9BRAS|nr:unnamed protein product [Arabis nemorensis]
MFDEAIGIFYKTKDAPPDIKAFNFLMNRMIASGENILAVSSFWQIARSVEGLDVDEHTYVLLVKAYRRVVCGLCNEMKIDAAEKVFLDMEKLLQCYCQMGKFSEAYDLFKEFRDMNISLDRVCYNVAMDALGKLGKVEEAIELFREMTGKGIAPDVVNYTTLIDGCCRLQSKCSVAFDLMIEMEETGKTPDIVIYNVLAGGLAWYGLAEEAFETLKLMEARGVEPTSVTHNLVIEGLIVAGKVDEAKAFYENMEHKSRDFDVSMVKSHCKAGRLDQAFERFIRLELPLSKNVYFTLFAEKDYISKAQELLERMWELGVEPKKSMYRTLIGAWCKVDNVRKVRQFFKDLVAKGIIPDVYTYTILINTYCRLNELKEAYALFKDMKRRGIKPDVVTYTVLLNSNPELDMKREMKALDVKPDVVYYTVLIDQQCKIGDMQEAERIFDEMIENGLKPDVKPYTALIVGCCRSGYVHKAVTLVKEMSKKRIEPTAASLSAVSYAILKAKRLRSRQ